MLTRTLFHAIFGRDIEPVAERTESLYRLWNVEGPLSAFEAYDIAERFARRRDADALYTHIESGDSLDARGRSARWRLRFVLPLARGVAEYGLIAGGIDAADDDSPFGVEIEETIAPAAETRIEDQEAPLPLPFLDSSRVAHELLAESSAARPGEGVIRKVETIHTDDGLARWRITLRDRSTVERPLAA